MYVMLKLTTKLTKLAKCMTKLAKLAKLAKCMTKLAKCMTASSHMPHPLQ